MKDIKSKLISAEQASKLIKNNSRLGILTVGPRSYPAELCKALERRFVSEGRPKGIEVIFNLSYGEEKGEGIDRFGHQGMVKRFIGSDYSFSPRISRLISKNSVQAYCFPSSVISEMFSAGAHNKPGVISKLGIGSFVDPRLQGGRLNPCSEEGLVEHLVFREEEWLFFKNHPLDAVILKAEAMDEEGNLLFYSPAAKSEAANLASAARKNGGLVIAEVKRIVERVRWEMSLPAFLFDYYVLAKDESKRRDKIKSSQLLNLSQEWEIIAGRVTKEIEEENKVFLSKRLRAMLPKIASSGKKFKIIADWFDPWEAEGELGEEERNIVFLDYLPHFCDTGLLDLAIVPFNQIDGSGNVNSSKKGHKIIGCNHLLEVCQNSKKVIFCGTFTPNGYSLNLQEGELRIIKDGRLTSFVPQVEQITFSSEQAFKYGQEVMYITERAVFSLHDESLVLLEIAPGVNLWQDVIQKMECEVIISPQLKLMDSSLFVKKKDLGQLSQIG